MIAWMGRVSGGKSTTDSNWVCTTSARGISPRWPGFSNRVFFFPSSFRWKGRRGPASSEAGLHFLAGENCFQARKLAWSIRVRKPGHPIQTKIQLAINAVEISPYISEGGEEEEDGGIGIFLPGIFLLKYNKRKFVNLCVCVYVSWSVYPPPIRHCYFELRGPI